MPLAVRVEEMVRGRVVLIDGLLDQAHAEDAGVEVEIFLCGSRNGGDVMEAGDIGHLQCSRMKAESKLSYY